MNVKELCTALGAKALCLPDPEREVHGGYAGDLLSWVMGRAPADAAWVTIMSNVNIVAVAMLRDVALVLVAEGAEVAEEVVQKAKEQGINLAVADADIYTLCGEIAKSI